MSEPAAVGVDEALNQLVKQFAEPLSFFRELIQNSLDAGSEEVDIRLDYEAGPDGGGVMIIQVDDWGQGMDREIIDRKLTRLFSSAKDGDMTKIGKFGIGFVSVFAIEPDAVCVDTARAGEAWRVLFAADRSFTRLRLSDPVEGTKIRIIKQVTRQEFSDYEVRAGEVIRFWCRHAAGDVVVQGESISEPFDLDMAVGVRHRDEFSEIVVGHRSGQTFQGFYNRGLTLAEASHAPLIEEAKKLVFKISSRYLEHTLSRDNVMMDKNFHRVREKLMALVDGRLLDEVLVQLESQLESSGAPSSYDHRYAAVEWHLARCGGIGGLSRKNRYKKVLRSPRGKLYDFDDLERASQVLLSAERTPLTDELERDPKCVVVRVPKRSSRSRRPCFVEKMLHRTAQRAWVEDAYCLAIEPEAVSEDRARARATLERACEALLRSAGHRVSEVRMGRLIGGDWIAKNGVAIACEGLRRPTLVTKARDLNTEFFEGRRALVLNDDDQTVGQLQELARTEPELAAHQVVKLFHLAGGELDERRDGILAQCTWEGRCRRLTS